MKNKLYLLRIFTYNNMRNKTTKRRFQQLIMSVMVFVFVFLLKNESYAQNAHSLTANIVEATMESSWVTQFHLPLQF